MTDLEKQGIETMQHWIDYEKANKEKINKADELIEIQETVLNLIEKQQEEIRQYEKALHDQIIKDYDIEIGLKEEIEKKDKIIDEMAKQLTTPIHSKEWVIEYYTKKVEDK